MRILRRRGYKPARVIWTTRAAHIDADAHLHFDSTPRVASSLRTPPGPEGSKGTRALAGTRGVPFTHPRRVVTFWSVRAWKVTQN